MLPIWATKPEMILTYFLFVLAAFISVYSTDIRRVLTIVFTVPPDKMRRSLKKSRLVMYQLELETLKRRHNNAYELILYLIIETGQMALWAIAFVFTFLVISLKLRQLDKGPYQEFALVAILSLSVVPLFVAMAVGKVYVQCRHLVHYDERVVYLENKIEQLKWSMEADGDKATQKENG